MKLRVGFVSNSSSASFIVAVNKVAECPHCKRSDPNFLDFVEKMGDPNDYECTKMHARGAAETIAWWKDNVGYQEGDKEWDEVFDKVRIAESTGREVGTFSIGYHDEITNSEWYQQQRRGAVDKIWSDH